MVHKFCRKCGSSQFYPKGGFGVRLEGGVEYPDILGCGAYPFLIVSQRVLEDWAREAITNYSTYRVEIVSVDSLDLNHRPAPVYYRVELDGRCRIDLAASGLDVLKHCPECDYLQTRPALADGFQMIPNSWDGSDVFRDIALYPRVSFCTRRVLELARKYQHTNFRFEFMQGPFDRRGMGISYL